MRIQVLALQVLVGASLLLPAAGAADGARDLSLGAVDRGSCPVAESPAESRVQKLANLESQLRAEMGERPGDLVVLNGRGYRYENDRVPGIARELQILEIELQRARAAAKAAPRPVSPQ